MVVTGRVKPKLMNIPLTITAGGYLLDSGSPNM
jgi:hypothetical protein